jgi:hypothetical protein
MDHFAGRRAHNQSTPAISEICGPRESCSDAARELGDGSEQGGGVVEGELSVVADNGVISDFETIERHA